MRSRALGIHSSANRHFCLCRWCLSGFLCPTEMVGRRTSGEMRVCGSPWQQAQVCITIMFLAGPPWRQACHACRKQSMSTLSELKNRGTAHRQVFPVGPKQRSWGLGHFLEEGLQRLRDWVHGGSSEFMSCFLISEIQQNPAGSAIVSFRVAGPDDANGP